MSLQALRRFSLAFVTALGATALSLSPSSAQAPLQKVSVALHFNVPQISWVGIYVAQDKGFYKEAGLDIDPQYLRGSVLAVQAVASGQSGIGIAGIDTVLAGALENLPITAVANHLQNDSTGLIVHDDGKVNSVADLKGKTISTAQTSAMVAFLKAMLNRAGLSNDVKVIYVDQQAMCTMVVAGTSDGCAGFNFAHLPQVRDMGMKAKFFPFSTPDRPLMGHVIIANNDYLARNPDVVRKFIAATARGYAEVDKNPQAAIEFLKTVVTTYPPKQLAEAVPMVVELTKSERSRANGFGWMTDAAWKQVYNDLVEGGALKPGLDVTKIYTNAYLPKQ